MPDSQPFPDHSTPVPFGTEKTPEDWIGTADWWLRELGEALPDASPMFKALVSLRAENETLKGERARCQHCSCLADERSFMCEDCASKADEEVQTLRDENERLRENIREAAASLCMTQCPAYKDNGVCESGCYTEPSCQTDEPAEGWIVSALNWLVPDEDESSGSIDETEATP